MAAIIDVPALLFADHRFQAEFAFKHSAKQVSVPCQRLALPTTEADVFGGLEVCVGDEWGVHTWIGLARSSDFDQPVIEWVIERVLNCPSPLNLSQVDRSRSLSRFLRVDRFERVDEVQFKAPFK